MNNFELIKIDVFKESNILTIVENIVDNIESGETRPLPAYIQAKALDFLSKEIIKRVKDPAMAEAETYGKDDAIFNGARFSIKSSGTLLNYDDDPEYAEIQKALKDRQDKLKRAFEMSKKGETLIDESGEVVPVVSIKKQGEQTLNISFK